MLFKRDTAMDGSANETMWHWHGWRGALVRLTKNIPYPNGQSPPGGIVNTGRAIYTRRNELLLMPLLMVCMTIMMIHFQESMVRKGSTHSCSLTSQHSLAKCVLICLEKTRAAGRVL